MRHLDRGRINHEGRDPELCKSFPRLIHLASFRDGLVAVVGKEEKRVALVDDLSSGPCSLKDVVSVLEAKQFED